MSLLPIFQRCGRVSTSGSVARRSYVKPATPIVPAVVALLALAWSAPAPLHAADPAPQLRSANDEVAALSRAWIEDGWRHQAQAAPFDFDQQLGRYYDRGVDLILHDNADPELRIATSAARYRAVWNDLIPRLRSLDNRLTAPPDVLASADLAVVTLRFESRFEAADGSIKIVPTLATLVWRRTETGWRIVREHGSALTRPHPAGG